MKVHNTLSVDPTKWSNTLKYFVGINVRCYTEALILKRYTLLNSDKFFSYEQCTFSNMQNTFQIFKFRPCECLDYSIWFLAPEVISHLLIRIQIECVKGWFPLRIKQRLHWFRKSTIATHCAIFILQLETYWYSHRVIVVIIATQNLLSWKLDGRRRVWYNVTFVFKTSKKKYSKC